MCCPGVIVGLDLAPANMHELPVAETLLDGAVGWALGDRNYWSPKLAKRLQNQKLHLLAPYKSSKRETKFWPLWLVQKRRRIACPGGLSRETVIGQWSIGSIPSVFGIGMPGISGFVGSARF